MFLAFFFNSTPSYGISCINFVKSLLRYLDIQTDRQTYISLQKKLVKLGFLGLVLNAYLLNTTFLFRISMLCLFILHPQSSGHVVTEYNSKLNPLFLKRCFCLHYYTLWLHVCQRIWSNRLWMRDAHLWGHNYQPDSLSYFSLIFFFSF